MTARRSERARPAAPPGRTGFDVSPARPVVVTVILFAGVVVLASLTAEGFRWALHHLLRAAVDRVEQTQAARSTSRPTLFVVATGTVLVAAAIGAVVQRRWSGRVGIEAIAASARGEDRSISLRATMLRVAATFIASAGLVSIGRESAIVESGGSAGAVAGRESGGRGDALASAGIAAAFASAYHAPVAAVLYAEEHLRIRRSVRASVFVVLGALAGHLVTAWWFGADALLPDVDTSSWRLVALGLLVLLPVVVVSKAFLFLRDRVTADAWAARPKHHRSVAVVVLAVVAGLAVAAFPLAAGNGMDALRTGPVASTTTLAVALVVGKLVGTTAALGSGAPGGVLTPTMAVAAGTALLVLIGLDHLGAGVAQPWSAMVPAMAIGVAVGMRSPLVGVVLVPELLGHYALVVPIAVVVAAAWSVDRLLDRVVTRLGAPTPARIHDEDA